MRPLPACSGPIVPSRLCRGGGLALGIGLLVDNSIVVLENIARHRDQGLDRLEAARRGAGEVGKAVTASTLTTVAVFFPLVFVSGIAGQLFRDQALTVTFSLLASLVVALTLIPMLAAGGKNKEEQEVEDEQQAWNPTSRTGRLFKAILMPFAFVFRILGRIKDFLIYWISRLIYLISLGLSRLMGLIMKPFVYIFQKFYELLERSYPGMLRGALRFKGAVLVLALVLFGLTLLLIPKLGVELIPQLSQGEFLVEYRMSPGTPLEQTDVVLASTQREATQLDRVQSTFAVAGSGNRLDANPDQGGENWGELNVRMKPGSARADEEGAMDDLRTSLERIPGLQYKFDRPTLFTFKTPVEVEVVGYDLKQLKLISKALANRIEDSPRFTDVKTTMEEGHPEVQIRFDRERAAALGIPVHTIAERVVDKVRGEVASQYSWRDRKIDILVRAREEDRASIDRIRKLIINPQSPRPVPLEAVAEVIVDTGPGEIRRVGQERVAVVTANLGFGDLGSAATELEGIIAQVQVPTGLRVRLAGQNEEMANSFRSLLFALLLAVFLVYLVMASQFESLLHPFVILFTIPLALIGAVWALWITGSTISVVVFIGLILLAGIVVNNAIVLIDLINQFREKGMAKYEAIVEGGRLRLRPILMTTLTTTLGLLPLAFGFGEGAEVRAPMAITVIGGLVISTLLTLVVIPVTYAVLDRKP